MKILRRIIVMKKQIIVLAMTVALLLLAVPAVFAEAETLNGFSLSGFIRERRGIP